MGNFEKLLLISTSIINLVQTYSYYINWVQKRKHVYLMNKS